jgi:short-subunit dehydrogenase
MPDSARPLAIVTGASAGLGRTFAVRLAARGLDLVLVSRDGARLAELGRELEARYGIAVEAFTADLSREDEIERVAARAAALGHVAVPVNNAGFGTQDRLATASPVLQAGMVRLHALAPMRLAQAVVPGMVARRAGAIINVSSVASFIYSAGNANYCATKAYLRVLSESLAAELEGTGVRVQALCPGFTHTEFHGRMGFDKSRIPASLWMSAEDVVACSLAAVDRGGPVVCVPGLGYQVLVLLLRWVPRGWIGRFTRR